MLTLPFAPYPDAQAVHVVADPEHVAQEGSHPLQDDEALYGNPK